MDHQSWKRHLYVSQYEEAQSWLTLQMRLGLARNTLDAYARGLDDYLRVCHQHDVQAHSASQAEIALYVNDMATRERPDGKTGLANATMQQRLTAVRLFYDYLIETGRRDKNPVGRGKYVPGRAFAGARDRGLIPHYRKLPWIPNADEWHRILLVIRTESLRNRLMFAMAYDSALRREELCSIETGDIDPASQLLHIRAETTKTRKDRVVPYSTVTSDLYRAYLQKRQHLTRERGALFRSDSPRNRGAAISIWTWSKVVKSIANRADVDRFSTHTLRHLCLTDLARCGWELYQIALFAGHSNTQTTLQYVHLSGRELGEKYQQTIDTLHEARLQYLETRS